jgi:EpsD family peptidyl-prolyl cis-trans isomerase
MAHSGIRVFTALLLSAGLVAGCHKASGPKGQVVATVYGREITDRMLQAETPDLPTDPAQRKKAQDDALKRIVERMVLAHAAEQQKLDKTPDYQIQLDRTSDQLKATMLERSLVQQVPTPAPADVQAFVDQHPLQFAQRKVYVADQVLAILPDPALAPEIAQAGGVDAMVERLKKSGAKLQRGIVTIDPLHVAPAATDKLNNIQPGQVITESAGDKFSALQVLQVEPANITGQQAQMLASKFLQEQHQQEAVQRQVKTLMDQASKDIQYNKSAG